MYRDMLSYERLSSSVCTQYISKLTITFHAGSYCTSPELLHILIFLRIEVPVSENSDPPIKPNVVKYEYTAAAANDSFQSLLSLLFSARTSTAYIHDCMLSALYAIARLSIRHMGGSVKNGRR